MSVDGFWPGNRLVKCNLCKRNHYLNIWRKRRRNFLWLAQSVRVTNTRLRSLLVYINIPCNRFCLTYFLSRNTSSFKTNWINEKMGKGGGHCIVLRLERLYSEILIGNVNDPDFTVAQRTTGIYMYMYHKILCPTVYL